MATRRNRRPRTNAILAAGMFLAFSAALATGLYLLYGKLGRNWRGIAELRVLFKQSRALQAGAPVLYDGMEIGRVKSVAIVRVGDDLLNNLPELSKRDVPNLPLLDRDREFVDRIPLKEVNGALRKIIRGRVMVLASFDVLIEHDVRRLREDDAYKVGTSRLGDSSIAIETGSGKPIVPRNGMVFVGVNADLISDIGKNLAQIEEIMQSMADIIGGDAGKAAIRDQLRNFAGFTANVDDQTQTMLEKVPQIMDELDLRLDDTGKNMTDVTERVMAIFPQVDAAIVRTGDSLAAMRGNLSKSADLALENLRQYYTLAKDEVARWRELSLDQREKTPARLKELRKSAEAALAAVSKLDEMLERFDAELQTGVAGARAVIAGEIESAMSLQETTWHFKQSPQYFSTKYTPEELKQRHLAWRFDMARKQYVELRRELAAIQAGMGVADTADRERAKIIEDKLAESDAFFGVNRADFVPAAEPEPAKGAEPNAPNSRPNSSPNSPKGNP